MSPGEIPELLERLAATAASLHQEATPLDDILQAVEARLASFQLGLEVWVEDQPLSVRELSVSASPVAPKVETQLGFAPVGRAPSGKWQLQVREAEYAPAINQELDDEWGLMRVLRQESLHKRPREERIAALRAVPALIEGITAATQQRIGWIQDAKQWLDSASGSESSPPASADPQ